MKGLTDEEVINNRLKYGSNKIDVKDDNKFFKLLLSTLGDPIIKIMLIALAIRIVLMFSDESWYETIGMLISILLSSLISTISEYGSNKAFRLLQKKYSNAKVTVCRNGIESEIDIDQLVVGDLVILKPGDVVGADGEIVDGFVYLDEKIINGESVESFKQKGDKLLRGTIVVSDFAKMKVSSVGNNSMMGSIAVELNNEVNESPMRIRLKHLATVISRIGYVGAILSVISYLINVLLIQNHFDYDLIINLISDPKYMFDLFIHAFTIGVTILLVVVPEGLPMMCALVLSSNMKRMLKSNVLVRKPVGIETSGSINVLLTDKTGTLTKGELDVKGIVLGDMEIYSNLDELNDNVKNIFIDSLVYSNNTNSTDKSLSKFIGVCEKKYEVISKKNFNSKDKFSSYTLSNGNTYYKGAYDSLIKKCIYYLDKYGNKKIITDVNLLNNILVKYTSHGYRVIVSVMNNIFLGFILIKDEIRNEAYNAIREIRDAGIDIIMITGDDKLTASSIANDLNMLDKNSIVLTHDEFINMTDNEVIKEYKNIKVLARAIPSDKARFAKILQDNELVVGMTGDGVNDALALKISDVGFSLGSGTEIAKEASDIVIIDDNIKSISNAIMYGRTIFKSIRKFIIFQLTMNVIALILSVAGPFLGITSPVTVMQMLWINMIMDTFAGLAYSFEIPLKKYMKELPIKKKENIINKYMYVSIILISLYTSLLLILFYKFDYFHSFVRNDYKYLLTAFFSIFIFSSIFNSFNARTERINLFSGILKNKVFLLIMLFILIAQIYLIYFGGELFRTFGLTLKEFMYVFIISFSVVPIDIIKKIIFKFCR